MTEFCSSCGKPLSESERVAGTMCSGCASDIGDASQSPRGLGPGRGWDASIDKGPIGRIGGATASESGSADTGAGSHTEGESYYTAGHDPYQWGQLPGQRSYDPDQPPWGAGTAIGVWLASVAAIFLLTNIGVGAWVIYQQGRGLVITADQARPDKIIALPGVALVVVLSTVVAHLITLVIVWAVVTGLGRRSIWKAPEWRWSWSNPLAKLLFILGIVIVMFVLDSVVGRFLPESKETDFDRLIKTSSNVRIVIALVAVLTAPLVEEWVYRGVLYSGLRRVAGVWTSVLVVAVLFAGVHFLQYWGAWAGMISITVLSLTLTIIRAKTKSILPCIAVHIVFNTVSSMFILSQHY
jgi:membrane protease YdiL (CAAX protease family)